MNKKKIILLTVFTLSLIAILQYPVNKIIKFETSQDYTVVKFKVKPIDPYDPMRGRYVWLNPEVPDCWIFTNKKQQEIFSHNQCGYAIIKQDADGFAEFLRLELNCKELNTGETAVKVKNLHIKSEGRFGVCLFTWPFTRFYLNELKAPELEKELQKQGNSFVLYVKIFSDGDSAVISLKKE